MWVLPNAEEYFPADMLLTSLDVSENSLWRRKKEDTKIAVMDSKFVVRRIDSSGRLGNTECLLNLRGLSGVSESDFKNRESLAGLLCNASHIPFPHKDVADAHLHI